MIGYFRFFYAPWYFVSFSGPRENSMFSAIELKSISFRLKIWPMQKIYFLTDLVALRILLLFLLAKLCYWKSKNFKQLSRIAQHFYLQKVQSITLKKVAIKFTVARRWRLTGFTTLDFKKEPVTGNGSHKRYSKIDKLNLIFSPDKNKLCTFSGNICGLSGKRTFFKARFNELLQMLRDEYGRKQGNWKAFSVIV